MADLRYDDAGSLDVVVARGADMVRRAMAAGVRVVEVK